VKEGEGKGGKFASLGLEKRRHFLSLAYPHFLFCLSFLCFYCSFSRECFSRSSSSHKFLDDDGVSQSSASPTPESYGFELRSSNFKMFFLNRINSLPRTACTRNCRRSFYFTDFIHFQNAVNGNGDTPKKTVFVGRQPMWKTSSSLLRNPPRSADVQSDVLSPSRMYRVATQKKESHCRVLNKLY